MKALLPVVMIALGLLAGAGAGFVLSPGTSCAADAPASGGGSDPCATGDEAAEAEMEGETTSYSYVELDNQFVIPVLSGQGVGALVVLSLSIEATQDITALVEAREPRLRDAILQVLFAHAQSGGFDGAFTTGQPMRDLRSALADVAVEVLGSAARGVLITDIVKQDM